MMTDILTLTVLNFISKIDFITWKFRFSKKEINPYFFSKEFLIAESTQYVHKKFAESICTVVAKNYNAIEENFKIRRMFGKIMETNDSPSINQLKKQYPEIYNALLLKEVYESQIFFKRNVEKGIQEGLYRNDLNYKNYISFYYPLFFCINGNSNADIEVTKLELEVINYHTRLMATPKGIIELEKQIKNI